MIDNIMNQQAEFVMPVSGIVLADAVRLRALPTPVISGAVSAAAGSKRRVDTTGVCGYRHITAVAVATATLLRQWGRCVAPTPRWA